MIICVKKIVINVYRIKVVVMVCSILLLKLVGMAAFTLMNAAVRGYANFMKQRSDLYMTLLCMIVFMIGSLQLIKEYREFNEFKRDETTFNEYKNKEEEYLEDKIQGDNFDW